MYNLTKRIKNTATVALSTTAAEVLPVDNNRGHTIVQNLDSSINVWVGTSAVSSSNGGIKLAPGEIYEYIGRDKLWAVAESGTPNLGLTIETIASNTVRTLKFAAVTAADAATRVAPRNQKRHKATVQNLSANSIQVGTEAGAGVVLAAGAKVNFYGVDAIFASGLGTNEVQIVTLANATGGTFTLTYAGQTTSALNYNATASAVQTALRALSTIGAGNVTVSGSGGGPYTVTFTGALANTNVAALTADGTSLTGSTPTVTVSTGTQGASRTYTVGVMTEELH